MNEDASAAARFFRGVIIGVPIGIALWSAGVAVVWVACVLWA